MAELLNCPFCAEPVTLRYSSVRRKFIVEHKVYNRFCIIEEIAFREESLASAIAAWNRRADAVPVVRCKECEYYNITCCSSGTGWCENMDMGVSDDFYCANGAKITNKETGETYK